MAASPAASSSPSPASVAAASSTSSPEARSRARFCFRKAARSSGEASTARRMAIEMTRSPSARRMPRTPVDSRPANTRTSPTAKRIARPSAVVSSTSWFSAASDTPTMCSSSPSFMAILPARFTLTKSDSLLRRTSPEVVANTTSNRSQLASSSGSGRIEVIASPCSIGSRFTNALPRALGSPSGSRQTFSL